MLHFSTYALTALINLTSFSSFTFADTPAYWKNAGYAAVKKESYNEVRYEPFSRDNLEVFLFHLRKKVFYRRAIGTLFEHQFNCCKKVIESS